MKTRRAYRYLGVLQNSRIKTIFGKAYFRKIKNIFKSRFKAERIIQAVNSKAVSLIRYGTGIEVKDMDRKRRKLLTMHRSIHPQSDVDCLCCKRAEGGRGLKSVEEGIELEKTILGFYLAEAGRSLTQGGGERRVI